MFDDILVFGVDGLDILANLVVEVGVVDIDGVEVVGEDVAEECGGGAEFGIDLAGGVDALEFVGHLRPAVEEVTQVGIEFGDGASFGDSADDDAEVLGTDTLHEATEAVTFFVAFDFLRDGYLV